MSASKLMSALAASESLTEVDLQLAGLMGRLARTPTEGDILSMTAALISNRRGLGHSCIHLDRWAGRSVGPPEGAVRLPSRDAWRSVLEQSELVAVSPSLDSSPRPLVLDGHDRLYLWRYWQSEQKLARDLRHRLEDAVATPPDRGALSPLFCRLFPDAGLEESRSIDWQAVAAAVALHRPFTLISGGPGTGKTTTVVKILALLATSDPEARIALAAPTGKAATRLEESIAEQLTSLPVDPEIRGRLPRTASTLHRLLGYSPRTDRFRHDRESPLAVDVLVVDEASMVDLLMMSCLLDALPADARLILLGDRDQLASVDTGFVFGDLVAASGLSRSPADNQRLPVGAADGLRRLLGEAAPESSSAPLQESSAAPLSGAAVELKVSYRFRNRRGIGELAAAVRAGDDLGAMAVLDDPSFSDVTQHALPARERARGVVEIFGDELIACVSAAHPAEALARLASFRMLAATRVGPWGTERLNLLVESFLESEGFATTERFYQGMPVLVESNDYSARLFNGDLGIVWPEDGRLWVFFPDDSEGAGELRRLPPAKLPPFSTAWAMTVHKSQGSEFDRVLMVLPDREMGDLLSRELLYTGLTRARKKVDLAARPSILEGAIRKTSRRSSGLTEALSADLGSDRSDS